MARNKPGRVARIPDSLVEQWDGLFELARREAARRVGAESETIAARQVWSDIVGVLAERYCGTEHRQLLTVDVKLDMILDHLGVPDEDGPRMRRITQEGQRAMADQARINREDAESDS